MHLKDFIQPNMIWANLTSRSKPEVIKELAQNISQNMPDLKADDIASVLINRENLGSTGLEDGIAIPHAKIGGLNKIVVACARSDAGVEFQAHDQKPTRLFFVLLAPESATATHLKILARLSRLLKESSFRERLLSAKQADDIYNVIIDEDKKQ